MVRSPAALSLVVSCLVLAACACDSVERELPMDAHDAGPTPGPRPRPDPPLPPPNPEPEPGPRPEPEPEPQPEPQPAIEIGRLDPSGVFVAYGAGASIEYEQGCQGGMHTWVSVRSAVELPESVPVTLSLTRRSDGSSIASETYVWPAQRVGDGWEVQRIQFISWGGVPDATEVTLRVGLEDGRDGLLDASLDGTTHLGPPCLVDGGSDGGTPRPGG